MLSVHKKRQTVVFSFAHAQGLTFSMRSQVSESRDKPESDTCHGLPVCFVWEWDFDVHDDISEPTASFICDRGEKERVLVTGLFSSVCLRWQLVCAPVSVPPDVLA